MGRENKIIKNIFLNILDNNDYDEFASNPGETNEIEELLYRYDEMYQRIIPEMEYMAKLEECIIQLRCRQVIESELKFTIQREYIYARSSFVRRGKETKDMRAIVGKIDIYGDDVSQYYNNKELVEKSIKSLYDLMSEEIKNNINNISQIVNVF